jgi:hypothetical protein
LTKGPDDAKLQVDLFTEALMSKIHKIFFPAPIGRALQREHKIALHRRCPYPAIHIPSEDHLATRDIFKHGQVDQFSFTIGLVLVSIKIIDGKLVCVWQLVVSPERESIRQCIDAPTRGGRPPIIEMLKSVPVMLARAPLIRGSGIFCTVVHRGSSDPDVRPCSDFLHAAPSVLSRHLEKRGFWARLFNIDGSIQVPDNLWANDREVVSAGLQLKKAAISLLHRIEMHPDIRMMMIERAIDFSPRDLSDHTLYFNDGGIEEGARRAMQRTYERGDATLCGDDAVSDADLEAVPEKPRISLQAQDPSQTIVPLDLPATRQKIVPPPPVGFGGTFIPKTKRGKPREIGRRVTPSRRKDKKKD